VKALDTNLIVRFLVNDDKQQGAKVRRLFERAEESSERLFIAIPTVLETLWVLSVVYAFERSEILDALDLLTQMPVLEFEQYPSIRQLIRVGRESKADLPDLLIGLSGKYCGCDATLTFEKRLPKTGLFELL
jgi:predicted nucleic-acid-binding protein